MRKLSLTSPFFLLLLSTCQFSTTKSDNLLENIMRERLDKFEEILKKPEKYALQILYTQIDRDSLNRPKFHMIPYRVNAQEYFYPASTIKLPVVALALEKLNQLNIPGLDKYSPLRIDSVRPPQQALIADSSAAKYSPNIAQFIKKVLLVSDNKAYNRLFEFLGADYIHEKLREKSWENIIISHRLANADFDSLSNRYTNPFHFYQNDEEIYFQAEKFSTHSYTYPEGINLKKGRAHVNAQGERIEAPLDFKGKNYASLSDLQAVLRSLIFPESQNKENRFQLSPDDYQFLYTCLGRLPKENRYPEYQEDYHQDGFAKYLMFGNTSEVMPKNIRIFNKVGLAYGYMIENAYVVDFEAKTEFFLSAVIYVNENQTLNDDHYEYESIGFPFFVELGKLIAEYEKKRPRKYLPDLSKFKLDFQEKK